MSFRAGFDSDFFSILAASPCRVEHIDVHDCVFNACVGRREESWVEVVGLKDKVARSACTLLGCGQYEVSSNIRLNNSSHMEVCARCR
jgi:hypothetical protein